MVHRPHRCALVVTLVAIFAACAVGATIADAPGDATHLVAEIEDAEPEALLAPPGEATIEGASPAPDLRAPAPLASAPPTPPPSPPPRR